MSMSANFHNIKSMKAKQRNQTTWLQVEGEGFHFALHMPYLQAWKIAAVFNGAGVDSFDFGEMMK